MLVNDPNVNRGDSGGPFYTWNVATNRMRVHGVLYGTTSGEYAKYTSVEHHLSWILATMSYTGGMINETATSAGRSSSWRAAPGLIVAQHPNADHLLRALCARGRT